MSNQSSNYPAWLQARVAHVGFMVTLPRFRDGLPEDLIFERDINNYIGLDPDYMIRRTKMKDPRFLLDHIAYWSPGMNKVDYTLYPHVKISNPLFLTLIRISYYNLWLQKVRDDETFRNSLTEDSYGLDFNEIKRINIGRYRVEDVLWYYAFSPVALTCIAFEWEMGGLNEKTIKLKWILQMVTDELLSRGKDKKIITEYFSKSLYDSLCQWQDRYIAYLVSVLRSFKGYENFQVSEFTIKENKKIINEFKGLSRPTQTYDRLYIQKKVRECKASDVEYGKLLFRLQHDFPQPITVGALKRTEYYLLLQQIGKVKFAVNGDYSNCNRGYNMEKKEFESRQ